MATRLPLATGLQSRDGTVSKDAKVMNALIEQTGPPSVSSSGQPVPGAMSMRKRPGSADLGLVQAGIAQLLYYWNGINTIQADKLSRGTIATIVSGPTQTSLTPTNASQMFSAQDTGSNAATAYLMFHNKTQAWSVTVGGVVASITLPAAIGTKTFSIPSLTRVSTTATATLTTDPVFGIGTVITVAGATPSAYNGAQTVTGVTPSSGMPAGNLAITITSVGALATASTVGGVAHGLSSGTYTISGASPTEYNGAKSITVTSTTQFTFAVTAANTITSPATGTITFNAYGKTGSMVISGSLATITCASHGLSTGASVSALYAGTTYFTNTSITVLDANTFTLATSGWPFGNGTFTVSLFAGLTISVASETSDGVTITINTTAAHHISSATGWVFDLQGASPAYYSVIGQTVTISGASQFTFTPFTVTAAGSITVATPSTLVPANFTFTIGGSPTTPATGTITGSYVTNLVPGIAYIDGYFNIMDENGVVYQSSSDNPTSWPALTFFTAQNETGAGVAIAKSLNWLVAFKEWSTEFFYDAKNPAPGSPFSPVDNGFTQIGCASGDSVRQLDGNLYWLSQTRQRGRGVYVMSGLQQQEISTPDIARILNADNLATVYAIGLKLDGHVIYLLTLVTSNITLAYDATSKTWGQWSSLTLGNSVSVTSITLSGGVATVTTSTAHGLLDGDPVNISGADQSNYNGIFHATFVSATIFTIPVTAGTITPATGTILAFPYTESYFKYTKYADCGGLDLVLHETNGHLYQILPTLRQDAGLPINTFSRTIRLDGGNTELKAMSQAIVVGDKVNDIVMMRWSDDDCGTYCAYRPVNLSFEQPKLRRSAQFRRRTIETKHIGNNPLRLEALEVEIIND